MIAYTGTLLLRAGVAGGGSPSACVTSILPLRQSSAASRVHCALMLGSGRCSILRAAAARVSPACGGSAIMLLLTRAVHTPSKFNADAICCATRTVTQSRDACKQFVCGSAQSRELWFGERRDQVIGAPFRNPVKVLLNRRAPTPCVVIPSRSGPPESWLAAVISTF